MRLIEEAFGVDRPTIGVVTQRKPEDEDPEFDDLFPIGTLARVLKVIRLSSGQYSVVLQGIARMRMLEAVAREPCLRARVQRLGEHSQRDEEIDALTAHLREAARMLMRTLPQPPREVNVVLDNVQEPGALCDLIASHLPITADKKQMILETLELRARLRAVLEQLKRQSEIHRVKKEVADMVQQEMSKSQRELLAAPATARDPARARRERQRGRGARGAARAAVEGRAAAGGDRRRRAASCRA